MLDDSISFCIIIPNPTYKKQEDIETYETLINRLGPLNKKTILTNYKTRIICIYIPT